MKKIRVKKKKLEGTRCRRGWWFKWCFYRSLVWVILGPEGTVIGGMLGGVMGCVGASVGAGRIIPNENEFTLVNLPLIPSIENNIYVIQNTNFDLDHISSIHNKLLLNR